MPVSSAAVLAAGLATGPTLQAHEIRPAVADLTVSAGEAHIELELTLEAFVAGIDLEGLDDTDDATGADHYDVLRAMDATDLERELRQRWPVLVQGIMIRAGDRALTAELGQVSIPQSDDTTLPRDSVITMTAALPADATPVAVGWSAANGPLILRQVGGGENAYSALLEGGALSAPIPRQGYATETVGSVFLRFTVQGFAHIFPKGADHIVFVLGLFFFSLHLRPLLVQVTSFTMAHTVTLALASLGIVSLPASIVEPLIAASIVFVAVENILRPRLGPWRTGVVFVFGLLHGLGFASVLGELGGGQGNFIARLIGFNVGVELGQLTVILAAFLCLGLWFGRRPWYRAGIAIPASLAIAATGANWFVVRVWGVEGLAGFVG